MNSSIHHDEFAFFNRQLAAMLRDGLPLEGALRQLSAGMASGPLRTEVEQLERDLASGTPLAKAIEARQLPDLYRRMIQAGAAGNDLPGILTLLADHYERANILWTRLKGLLTYPVLVLLVSLGLTALISFTLGRFFTRMFEQIMTPPPLTLVSLWAPPVLMAIVVGLGIAIVCTPRWRGALRWGLPGFREASLSELASAISLMLGNGTPLRDALVIAEHLETDTAAATQLREWRTLTEAGQGNPARWPSPKRPIPPLFLWVVQSAGDNLTAGFQKAAEIYRGRASYRIELLLYGALPISILLLGQMVVWQAAPMFRALIWMMNMLGDVGGN